MNVSRIVAILLGIVCIGLGAASLNLVQQNRDLNSQIDTINAARQAAPRGEWGESTSGMRQALAAVQEANDELRQELAKLKGEPPPPKTVPAPFSEPPTARPNRGGTEAWLERIKQEDPERYKQVVAEREQRRQEAQDWFANTLEQLQARAQSPATPDEAALVNQISDALGKLNDLRQQLAAARQLPDDQRQEQMAQLVPAMQATWQELSKLREQDRALQYEILGRQLGLSEDKAKVLATSIPTINQNTQYTPRGGGFGLGGGQRNPVTDGGTPGR